MNASVNTSTRFRDEADMVRDRQIKMHTRTREVHRSESTKSKESAVSAFMAFSSMVGILTVSIAVMVSIIAGIGYLYNWLSPIMDKCIEWFFAHSIGLFIGIGVISILVYVFDAVITYVRKVLS